MENKLLINEYNIKTKLYNTRLVLFQVLKLFINCYPKIKSKVMS